MMGRAVRIYVYLNVKYILQILNYRPGLELHYNTSTLPPVVESTEMLLFGVPTSTASTSFAYEER